MVRFEKDKLIIEVDSPGERPLSLYYRLIDSLLEVVWFALEDNGNDMIRKEAGILAYYLLNTLLMKGKPDSERMLP